MADYNIFIYGEAEISYLKKRDKRLAEVIDKVGPIERKVIPDLFAALINSIVGQQISTKAHRTGHRRENKRTRSAARGENKSWAKVLKKY